MSPENTIIRWGDNRHILLLYLLCFSILLLAPRSASAIMLDPGDAATVATTDICTGPGGTWQLGTSPDLFTPTCPKEAANAYDPSSGDEHRSSFFSLGLFSQTICQYETALTATYAQIFCAMQNALRAPFMALSMVYVAIMATLFMLGILPLTGGAFMMAFLKLVIVWTLAFNAEAAIGIMYNGLMQFLTSIMGAILGAWGADTCNFANHTTLWESVQGDGAAWSWNHTEITPAIQADCMNTTIGDTIPVSVGDGTYQTIDMLHHLDTAFNNVFGTVDPTNPDNDGKNSWGLLLATFMFPGGSLLGGLLIGDMLMAMMLFARAVLGYILATTGITLLVMLFPIFGALALFQTTHYLFDAWLKYLISFILQVPLIMAFLMLSQRFVTDPLEYVRSIKDRILLMDEWFTIAGISIPKISPAFCRFHEAPFPGQTIAAYEAAIVAGTHPEVNLVQCATDRYNDRFVLMSKDVLDQGPVIMRELFFQFISLLLIAYLLNTAMRKVPSMAKQLAGVKFAGRLGAITPADTASIESGSIHMLGGDAISSAAAHGGKAWLKTKGPGWIRSVQSVRAGVKGFREGSGSSHSRGFSGDLVDEASYLGSMPDAYKNSPQKNVVTSATRWLWTLRKR